MKNKEIIIISAVILIYTVISFINLGSLKNPQSFWRSEYSSDEVILELEDDYVQKIKFYNGVEAGEYKLYTSLDGSNYIFFEDINKGNCFAWNQIKCDRYFKYIKIEAQSSDKYLGEIAFYDDKGNQIKVSTDNENGKFIIDEQSIVPEKISFMNSTYFDEVYHPNFAYKYVNGMQLYDVHPPLRKINYSFWN